SSDVMTPAGPHHHLAALLHADVAGFSKLMAADEGGTRRALANRMGRLRERVETVGGRVVNTAGDSLLAEFPSIVAALDCAVSFQAQPDQGLRFRIGLHVGEVIADGTDLFGDGVNVA